MEGGLSGRQDRPRDPPTPKPLPQKPALTWPVVRGSFQGGSRLSHLAKCGCLAGCRGRSQG